MTIESAPRPTTRPPDEPVGAGAAFDRRVIGLACRSCRRPEPLGPSYVCPACLGPLEVVYDPAVVRAAVSRPIIEARPQGLSVILLDEYLGLPAGHPVRCDVQLRRTLIDRLDPAPAGLVTFDVDGEDPDAACLAFDAEIAALGGLDLVLLGLGMNGHIGMNEPGTSRDAPTRVTGLAASTIEAARRYGADPPPTRGVTLGVAKILAAREIWLLATGERKAGILATTLEGPVTPDVPASLLRGHRRLRVFADDAAMP